MQTLQYLHGVFFYFFKHQLKRNLKNETMKRKRFLNQTFYRNTNIIFNNQNNPIFLEAIYYATNTSSLVGNSCRFICLSAQGRQPPFILLSTAICFFFGPFYHLTTVAAAARVGICLIFNFVTQQPPTDLGHV